MVKYLQYILLISLFIFCGCSGASNETEFRKSGPTYLKRSPTRVITIHIPYAPVEKEGNGDEKD
jgi:hypothetical protein